MLTVQDFIAKYETYTDEELFQINATISDYSEEAKNALEAVLKKRGGLETITKGLEDKAFIAKETTRVEKEVTKLSGKGTNADFLKTLIKSDILPEEQVHDIIDTKFAEVEAEEEDMKIKPRTVFGSIIGCGIASVVGGILWGLEMIYSNRIFYILVFGLAVLCYGIIKFLTKQSKNDLVIIATVIAVILALGIGRILYNIIGYQG